MTAADRIRFGVVRNVDLLQLRLGLDRFNAFLLHIPVGGFPHIIIFDDVLQRFPGQLKSEIQLVINIRSVTAIRDRSREIVR